MTTTHLSKSQIVSELICNTGVDRRSAIRLLHENNWQLASVYQQLDQAHLHSSMQNEQNKRGIQIPIQHVPAAGQASLYTQRGGGSYPTNMGVGRVSGPTILTSRPGYENIPVHQQSASLPKFPVDNYCREGPFIDSMSRSGERVVPIQVERGAALKLTTPMVPQQHSYQQQLRPKSEPRLLQQQQLQPHKQQQQQVSSQRQDKFQEPMPKLSSSTSDSRVDKTKDVGSSSSAHKSSGGDHTPKLKRGISNIMENVNLVCEARSSVLHDIEEDSHDHMYLMTFLLPDLTIYAEDFRAYLEKDLIETSTLVSLEQAGRLNWWAEMRIAQRLLPMATSGDGNCLLHAASLVSYYNPNLTAKDVGAVCLWQFSNSGLLAPEADTLFTMLQPRPLVPEVPISNATMGTSSCSSAMWGIHDRQLILRNALYDKMTSSVYKDQLYRRWRWQTNITNLESGLMLSEDEWQVEWKNLLRLASTTPRTFPELSKRNSCCDSLVTQGNASSGPVVYESLEEFHVFVLAHVLQRPIIIVADTLLKDSGGEALAPIPFGGIYLPLECGSRSCHRSPLLLTYDAAHFSALVPMEQEKPFLPAAIPLVDPSFKLLPLHFHVDPGPYYDWEKVHNNKTVKELTAEDKLNLLQLYMNVEKLQLPGSETDYDSDKMSCGSCESDDSVSCVGNKEKKKDAKMHSVAKQFGSIGKSVGKKLKKNFGNIGKAMKNIGDPDKHRRQSVGSIITQSTKVIASIATDIGRERMWCARLSVSRTKMQHDLVKNYLQTSRQRFERDKDLWSKKNEEIRNRASQLSISSTVACVTSGCQMFGTSESAYLCSKCYAQQKQEAIEKEDGGQFAYNTFPGRNKESEEAVKMGKSKFYTDVDILQPSSKDMKVSVDATMDRLQSRSLGDMIYSNRGYERVPSPDYDNVDYKSSNTRPASCLSETVSRGKVSQGSVPTDNEVMPQSFQGNKCNTEGCDFFGSTESDDLCSRCYRKHQVSLQEQTRAQTRL